MQKTLLKNMDKLETLDVGPKTVNQKIWKFTHSFFGIISKRMDGLNMSNKDLADKLGVSKAHISQLMNGKPNISIEKMVKMADAVDLELKITSDEVDVLKEEYKTKFKKENLKILDRMKDYNYLYDFIKKMQAIKDHSTHKAKIEEGTKEKVSVSYLMSNESRPISKGKCS